MKGCLLKIVRLALIAGLSVGSFCIFHTADAVAQTIITSGQEQEAYDLVSQQKYIKARTEAEKLLERNPDSIIGNYVLGRVFHMGEGDLLRAQRMYREAIERFEAKYFKNGAVPENAELRAWHMQFLSEEAQIYAELDQRENELRVYERIRTLYDRPFGVRASWALMKLGRYEEAKAVDQSAISGSDRFARSVAYNDLTAIEDARHHYLEAYKAGKRAVEFTHEKDCVILTNQARNEMYFLRTDAALSLVTKAEKTGGDTCPEPPLLSALEPYLMRLELQKAISVMKKVRKTPISKRMRVQTEMNIRISLAELLMTLGYPDKARTLMKTVIEAPGRMGYNSLPYDQVMLAGKIFYYATIRDDIRRIEAEVSIYRAENGGWLFDSEGREIVKERVELLEELKRTRWSITQQALKSMMNPDNVTALVVPLYVYVSPIFNDALVEVAGRGTVKALIEREKASILEEESAMFKPAWDLLLGYIHWRDGRYKEALSQLNEADSVFTNAQRILKVICAGIRGAIYYETGKVQDAYNEWRQVVMDYPVLFRQYGIRLPVAIDSEMTGELREKIERVIATDAFELRADSPYIVNAQRSGEWLQLCLTEKTGRRVACSSMVPVEYGIDSGGTAPDWQVMSNFITSVFSPRVDLSQMDVHSLDGSPVRTSARQALDGFVF